MGRLSPYILARQEDIPRYDDLKSMLEQHGFKVREGNGTSHSFAIHPDESDLTLTLNRSASSVRYHKEAAKACIEVLEREQKREVIIETDQDQSYPPDISVKTRGDTLILRHKDFPVIGLSLGFDPDKNGIADIATRRASTIRERVSGLKTILKTLEQDHGIVVESRNGSLIIEESDSDKEIEIKPYHPLTQEDPLKILEGVIETLANDLKLSTQFWDSVRDNKYVSDLTFEHSESESFAQFDALNVFTGRKKTIRVPVDSDNVVSDEHQIAAMATYLDHMFEDGTFAALQKKYGIDTKGKDGSSLRFSQPMLDLETRVHNPRPAIAKIMKVIEDLRSGGSIDDRGDMVVQGITAAQNTWNEMAAFASLVVDQMEENRKEVHSLNRHISSLGLIANKREFKKHGRPHKITLAVKGEDYLHFEMPAMTIKMTGRDETLLDVRHIDRLHKFIAQATDRVLPFAASMRERAQPKLAFPLANPNTTAPASGNGVISLDDAIKAALEK